METITQAELLGFLELQVGSIAVQVPIRAAEVNSEDAGDTPVASFAVEGDACAILVRNDRAQKLVERAVQEVAEEALKHYSRKLLN